MIREELQEYEVTQLQALVRGGASRRQLRQQAKNKKPDGSKTPKQAGKENDPKKIHHHDSAESTVNV